MRSAASRASGEMAAEARAAEARAAEARAAEARAAEASVADVRTAEARADAEKAREDAAKEAERARAETEEQKQAGTERTKHFTGIVSTKKPGFLFVDTRSEGGRTGRPPPADSVFVLASHFASAGGIDSCVEGQTILTGRSKQDIYKNARWRALLGTVRFSSTIQEIESARASGQRFYCEPQVGRSLSPGRSLDNDITQKRKQSDIRRDRSRRDAERGRSRSRGRRSRSCEQRSRSPNDARHDGRPFAVADQRRQRGRSSSSSSDDGRQQRRVRRRSPSADRGRRRGRGVVQPVAGQRARVLQAVPGEERRSGPAAKQGPMAATVKVRPSHPTHGRQGVASSWDGGALIPPSPPMHASPHLQPDPPPPLSTHGLPHHQLRPPPPPQPPQRQLPPPQPPSQLPPQPEQVQSRSYVPDAVKEAMCETAQKEGVKAVVKEEVKKDVKEEVRWEGGSSRGDGPSAGLAAHCRADDGAFQPLHAGPPTPSCSSDGGTQQEEVQERVQEDAQKDAQEDTQRTGKADGQERLHADTIAALDKVLSSDQWEAPAAGVALAIVDSAPNEARRCSKRRRRVDGCGAYREGRREGESGSSGAPLHAQIDDSLCGVNGCIKLRFHAGTCVFPEIQGKRRSGARAPIVEVEEEGEMGVEEEEVEEEEVEEVEEEGEEEGEEGEEGERQEVGEQEEWGVRRKQSSKFSDEEDAAILRGVRAHRFGSWTNILADEAAALSNRSSDSIRNR